MTRVADLDDVVNALHDVLDELTATRAEIERMRRDLASEMQDVGGLVASYSCSCSS